MNELNELFAQVFGTPVASDPVTDYVAWMSRMLASLLVADRLPVLSIITKRYGKMDLKLVAVYVANGKIMFRFASPVAQPSYGQFNGAYFAEDTILHTTTTKDAESAIACRMTKATKEAYKRYC